MKSRKFSLIAAGIALTMTMAACAGEGAGSSNGRGNGDGSGAAENTDEGGEVDNSDLTVGVAMPTQSMQRWLDDGNNMKAELEAEGYNVDLQYAEDDIPTQVSQIENMVTQGVDVLVIASIDGSALTSALESAAENDIPVIAYDRLIRDSEHVNYYTTFDNYQVGQLQGNYLVEALGLPEAEGPFNVEVFAGSPDDNNATFFWQGAIDVIEPFIESGQIVIPSGQTSFEQAAILRWEPSTAQARMDNLMTGNYSDKELHAVLSPNDSVALGIVASLDSLGYGAGQDFPIITGQDADRANVTNIIAGKQTMTVFKDTRALAKQAVNMVDALLKGTEPEVNDTETYDNGVKVVPSYLLIPYEVDIDNYEEILIESGYYDADELS